MSPELKFVLIVVGVWTILCILIINDWQVRRAAKRDGGIKPLDPEKERDQLRGWTPVLIFGLGVPFVSYLVLFTSWFLPLIRWVTQLGPYPTTLIIFLLFIVGTVAWVRWKSRHNRWAVRMFQSGNPDGAIALLRAQLQKSGPEMSTLNTIAQIYCARQDWDNALLTINEAEACGRTIPSTVFSKGFILEKSGRPVEAVEYFRRASELAPNDLTIAFHYGLLLAELGRKEEAAQMLERAETIFKASVLIRGKTREQVQAEVIDKLRDKIANIPATEA